MCNPVVLKEFWLKTGSKLTHGFRDEGGGGKERGVESLDPPRPKSSLKIQLNSNFMSASCLSSLSLSIKTLTFKVLFLKTWARV